MIGRWNRPGFRRIRRRFGISGKNFTGLKIEGPGSWRKKQMVDPRGKSGPALAEIGPGPLFTLIIKREVRGCPYIFSRPDFDCYPLAAGGAANGRPGGWETRFFA
jgi:hypothetical protein